MKRISIFLVGVLLCFESIAQTTISGKITGAGGGGHILFYCEKQKQPKLKEKMESLGLKHIQFKFYNGKPKVLNLYEQMKKY